MFTSRCFIMLLVMLGIAYYVTAKTSTEWSERKTHCPVNDTETHKCSSVETRQDTCIRREKCCNDNGDSSSSEDSDNCRFCDKTVICEKYKCNTQCCEGFDETTNGQCIHSTDCDCENNGECTTKGGKPFCNSKNGFAGDKCQIEIPSTQKIINRPITRANQRDNTIGSSGGLQEVTTVVSTGSKDIYVTEKVAVADVHEDDGHDYVNIGVVVGVICGIIIVVVISGVAIWRRRRGQKATLDRDIPLEQTFSSFEKKDTDNSLGGAASPMLERTENVYDTI